MEYGIWWVSEKRQRMQICCVNHIWCKCRLCLACLICSKVLHFSPKSGTYAPVQLIDIYICIFFFFIVQFFCCRHLYSVAIYSPKTMVILEYIVWQTLEETEQLFSCWFSLLFLSHPAALTSSQLLCVEINALPFDPEFYRVFEEPLTPPVAVWKVLSAPCTVQIPSKVSTRVELPLM